MKNNNLKKSFLFFLLMQLILIGIQSENLLEAMELKESQIQDFSINSVAECRQVFMDLALWLDNNIITDSSVGSIYLKFLDLPDEAYQIFYENIPNRSAFARAVQVLNSQNRFKTTNLENQTQTFSCNPIAVLCEPEYPPEDGTYSSFISSLRAFDQFILYDQDGDGHYNDEHTDEDWIGGLFIANFTLDFISKITKAFACLEPTKTVWCFASEALSAAKGLVEFFLYQTSFQDGLVDSAEIRAAYKNTLMLSDDLNAHDSNLAIHETSISQKIRRHNANLAAHDVHIDQELTEHNNALSAHDAKMTGKTDQIQFTLDNVIEPKKVHLQVIELKDKREFLVSTSEGGRPVSNIEFISVRISERARVSFVDVTTSTSASMVAPGTYLVKINLPKGSENVSFYTFEVKHTNDVVDHFGFTLFDRGN